MLPENLIQYKSSKGEDMTIAVYMAAGEQQIVVSGGPAASAAPANSISVERATVTLDCPSGTVEEFPVPPLVMKNPDIFSKPVVGRVLVGGELEEWRRFQAHVDPIGGIKKIETYAKWLFAGNALILLLIAGKTTTDGWPAALLERGPGALAFVVCIALLGISFALTSLALSPRFRGLNPFSRTSIVTAFDAQFRYQRPRVRWAAVTFALALAVAGLVQGARLWGEWRGGSGDRTTLHYTVKPGTVTAALVVSQARQNSMLELHVLPTSPRPGVTPAVARARSLKEGADSLTLTVSSDTSWRSVQFVGCWQPTRHQGRETTSKSCSRPDLMRSDSVRIVLRPDAAPGGAR